jgi:pSer/pThr/pTyr-binding forkhead associated (FHA) protein
LGRDKDCFVHLQGTSRDKLISRLHCMLWFDAPTLRIRDLGSRNGTFVNGKRIETATNEDETTVFAEGEQQFLTVGGTTIQMQVLECPPAGVGPGTAMPWQAHETAQKDCAVVCA